MTAQREWTVEQALEADEQFRRDNPRCTDAHPGRPVFQWAALNSIEAERLAIEGGDGFALLGAVRKCANHYIAMPEWLARAFIARYDRVLNCHVDSWDDAFGRPYPEGAHLNRLRKHRQNRLAVHNAVLNAVSNNPEVAIDEKLFARVGKPLALGKTLTQKLYYEACHQLGYGAADIRKRFRSS